jgi:transcriptional regulator
MVASHYPAIVDEEAEGIVILSHVGRPDDEYHELGQHEVLVIVQGPHGYVSASLYDPGELAGTWDHVTAHLYGVPEILSDSENFEFLRTLGEHFEHAVPGGRSILEDERKYQRVARGARGFRLRVARFEALAKLSQERHGDEAERIMASAEPGGILENEGLARERRRISDRTKP